MTGRLVLDESSWAAATGVAQEVLSDAIECLLERLDVARGRGEAVVRHGDYYEADLGEGVRLYSALFEPGSRIEIDRDIGQRLALALEQMDEFDDSELVECDAQFGGEVRFAPGVVWAHGRCSARCQVAVLPIPLNAVPLGRVPVTVAGATLDVMFVGRESQHVGFFRSVIALEHADEVEFENLARSAFPALEWADNVWRGLGHFSRPYIDVRDELVGCLGGLSDHGARCFHEYRAGDPRELAHVLTVQVGVETSDENGRTKKDPPSRRDRTRRHRGSDKIFWWHVKLKPHVDRIYFLYEPQPVGGLLAARGRIVVGLFKAHGVLPSRG